jgi:hypothetical protein
LLKKPSKGKFLKGTGFSPYIQARKVDVAFRP